ncbi:MAG: hypothetical protein LBE36_02605 [Flavobacteriaceae bacterium]|jgi:predicted nuclease of predicted toxin-antitoxin system|nr:hypothetical protein [Flavobacteriaceae bacterium]
MKILLDECITKKLKFYLSEFEVFTVSEMKWNGIKNGKLMTLCIDNGFDMLLTIDKNLIHQQNINKHKLIIVVLNSSTSKIEELILFLPSFKTSVSEMKKSNSYLIEKF